MNGLIQLELRATLNERRPALLETRVIFRPDVRRTSLVGCPVVAVVVPLRAGSGKIYGLLALKELNAQTHANVEGDMAVHQPLYMRSQQLSRERDRTEVLS